jgi:acetolactate synthase-1/2/3 large subunit
MSMNGAESLVQTLLACGVDTCFANPGTSEMHFVAALDRVPGMRCVLGLFEGVVTGAADGYARMAGKPAATLLHCGPGLANGLANLHNARRATTMMVNCVGDQATHHRPLDAPLTADTEGWARGVSGWVRTASQAGLVGADAAAAVQAARTSPGTIATLILPSDTCWNPGGLPARPLPVPPAPQVAPHVVRDIARLLRRGEPTMLLLATDALRAAPLADAHRIAAATGVKLWAPTSNRRIERGAGRYPIDRVPYAIEQAVAALAGIKHVVLVGAQTPPVGFFGYPNKPGVMTPPDAVVHVLARPEHDLPAVLAALADELGAPAVAPPPGGTRPQPARGEVTPETFAASLAALLPEDAIIADESVSFGRSAYPLTEDAAPHDWIAITGGAIGNGIPLATGAAIACPGRRVVTLEADGSAMYTFQGLWTQARENLDVTTIVFANRKYAILLGELANVGANPGRTALDMLDLTRPALDFVKMGESMGVPGGRADTMERFNDLFAQSCSRRGPFLIELVIS